MKQLTQAACPRCESGQHKPPALNAQRLSKLRAFVREYLVRIWADGSPQRCTGCGKEMITTYGYLAMRMGGAYRPWCSSACAVAHIRPLRITR